MSYKNMGYMQQENINRIVLKESPFKIFLKDNLIFRIYKRTERYNFKETVFYYAVGFKGEVLIGNITASRRTKVYNKVEEWFKNLELNGFEVNA